MVDIREYLKAKTHSMVVQIESSKCEYNSGLLKFSDGRFEVTEQNEIIFESYWFSFNSEQKE